MQEGSKLLINEPTLRVSKTIATDVGIKAATILAAIRAFGKNGAIDQVYLQNVVYFISPKALTNYLNKLLRHGFITGDKLTESEIIAELKAKRPFLTEIGLGKLKCAFCSGYTLVLHRHHLSKKRTIDICPNCHYEFHHLKRQKGYRINEQVVDD